MFLIHYLIINAFKNQFSIRLGYKPDFCSYSKESPRVEVKGVYQPFIFTLKINKYFVIKVV